MASTGIFLPFEKETSTERTWLCVSVFPPSARLRVRHHCSKVCVGMSLVQNDIQSNVLVACW